MTRIKQPQSGEHWWCEANSQSVVLMCQGLWNGQYQWACEYDDYIRPIARVLMPDEVAAMQANIDRLKIDWRVATDLSERQMNEKYMAWVENHRQRETIAELMAQVKKAVELLTPAVEAHLLGELVLPPMIAALTRAKQADHTVVQPDTFLTLVNEGLVEAEKAMKNFPQPNYVISKIAEEAGEVVKAAIHCAEGHETAENVRGEMRKLIATLYRLWIEGDQVHGLGAVAGQETRE